MPHTTDLPAYQERIEALKLATRGGVNVSLECWWHVGLNPASVQWSVYLSGLPETHLFSASDLESAMVAAECAARIRDAGTVGPVVTP